MSRLPRQPWAGFGPDHFRVHSLTGKEAVSSAWSFDVVVTGEAGGDAVEQTALGQRATLLFNFNVVAAQRGLLRRRRGRAAG